MGAIVSTDVTVVESWDVPLVGGKTNHHRIVDVALSGNGGTADDIPASTLGFYSIKYALPVRFLVTADSSLLYVPVVVEEDGFGILTLDLTDATDATRASPANVSAAGTLRVLLVGIRSQT